MSSACSPTGFAIFAGFVIFLAFISNQQGSRIERLEQTAPRAHAVVEDRIRCGKDTGLRNLPFRSFAANAAWLELVLIAQDLLAWTQRLLLSGELARCEPKRLRYRLLHVAGRLTRHARRQQLHLPRGWAWGNELLQAFARLRALHKHRKPQASRTLDRQDNRPRRARERRPDRFARTQPNKQS